jgi:hypothetical protein
MRRGMDERKFYRQWGLQHSCNGVPLVYNCFTVYNKTTTNTFPTPVKKEKQHNAKPYPKQ